jgi:hypothetical protein
LTQVKPKYDVKEESTLLETEAAALKELGATTLVTSATPFGVAPVQAVAYPTYERRQQIKANIQGETNG